MSSKLSTASVPKTACLFFCFLFLALYANSQEIKLDTTQLKQDSLKTKILKDSLGIANHILKVKVDSVLQNLIKPEMKQEEVMAIMDSVYKAAGIQLPGNRNQGNMPPEMQADIPGNKGLAPNKEKENKNSFDAKIEFEAIDSIRFDINDKNVHLYKEAKIIYEKVNLEADKIEVQFNENLMNAEASIDSSGKVVKKAIFSEGQKTYKSEQIKFNYKTKKGYIKGVQSLENEGYIRGGEVKKLENDNVNIHKGSFTTCDCEDCPHFEFRFKKSKVIPNNKIITGPAYFVIENIPTPLFIPFGLFPTRPDQISGIVMPSPGESTNKGFYLQNGGYYWSINDYLDLKVLADIYSYGSWAIKPTMNYAKRYKYRGSVSLAYAVNKTKDREGSGKDFSIKWSHSQDAKARPNSRFSANVNIVSSKFNDNNPTSENDYLSNTFQSSISFQTKIAGKHSLTLNGSHSQNTKTKKVNITLPEMSFSVNRFHPFRAKNKSGNLKWYDNISVQYSMRARNTVSIADSLLFKPGALKQFRNGIQHTIPISSNIKVLKHFNLTSSINFTDRMYFSRTIKRMEPKLNDEGVEEATLVKDTIAGFNNVLDYRLSASLNTKIYGMLNFKKGPVRAFRHVVTPSVSFSYTPDFSTKKWGYYDYYYTNLQKTDSVKYSYYDGYIYGVPSSRKQGVISFSISNNIEIKVPSKKDTITGMKKVVLIENFTISTSYDMNKDSLNWSKISMSGRTTLFKKLRINYSSVWDPYVLNADGQNINRFEWAVNRRLFRLVSSRWTLGLSYRFDSQTIGKNRKKKKNISQIDPNKEQLLKQLAARGESGVIQNDPALIARMEEIQNNPNQYIDWDIPWQINLNYNYSRSVGITYKDFIQNKDVRVTQTLGVQGNVSLTPKMKIGFRTGYDFENKEISYTSLNIYRDLHCWDMSFNWIPMGQRASWSFTIKIKASLLKDFKYEKRKQFWD